MNIPDCLKTDLQNCGYPQLFGSRSMALRPAVSHFDPVVMIGSQISSSTDWDFSQQYSDEIHHYLISAGYAEYGREFLGDYADDLTVAVYIKEFHPAFNWKLLLPYNNDDVTKVNIVLHSDELLFRRVWSSISPKFYYSHLWKRSPCYDHIDYQYEIKSNITTIMNQLYVTARVEK